MIVSIRRGVQNSVYVVPPEGRFKVSKSDGEIVLCFGDQRILEQGIRCEIDLSLELRNRKMRRVWVLNRKSACLI